MVKIRHIILNIRQKRIAWVFLTVIISSYTLSIIPELDDEEPYPDYYNNILTIYLICDPMQMPAVHSFTLTRNFLKEWFNCFGYKVLGNDRVLPFAFSIGIVYLVYLLGHYITNDRIIGLIASATLSINPLLTRYDTSPTYDQAWVFFIILSVVLLYKKSIIAPVVYPIAILTKILAVSYMPVFLYHVISEKINNKKLVLCITLISIILGIITLSSSGMSYYLLGFHPERLAEGFVQLFIHIRVLLPILVLFAFLIVFFRPERKIIGLKITCIWMFWILLTTPLIYIFSQDFQFSYRYVPFAAFMSVFIGMAIVNFGNKAMEIRLTRIISDKGKIV